MKLIIQNFDPAHMTPSLWEHVAYAAKQSPGWLCGYSTRGGITFGIRRNKDSVTVWLPDLPPGHSFGRG